jgi:hypothetical protein
MQMQYMQIYYQQPFVPAQDMRSNVELSPSSLATPSPTYLDSFKIDEIKTASRKQSSESSEYSDLM